ncbi:MarR family transcriptional regulator [Salinilacihabitans rarus]|uniref:MarR family transcriptional regulator n=1 Tax=Salinilacihabitans rarus TaxID=2961596 RepID=UPI0020C85045|nr:MarR family transcriptional regulator [Salinilacihabitans rarus]
MPEQLPPEIVDDTPATRLVYLVLEDTVLNQTMLAERTGLSTRRAREAANNLVDRELLISYRDPTDQRRRVYYRPDCFASVVAAHRSYTKLR